MPTCLKDRAAAYSHLEELKNDPRTARACTPGWVIIVIAPMHLRKESPWRSLLEMVNVGLSKQGSKQQPPSCQPNMSPTCWPTCWQHDPKMLAGVPLMSGRHVTCWHFGNMLATCRLLVIKWSVHDSVVASPWLDAVLRRWQRQGQWGRQGR